MTAPSLSSEAQLRYILQWFGEFSELQREDFVPILAAAKSGNPDLLADALARLSCQDKPVSLFQCRIKLFNKWYPSWTEEEQERLISGVTEIDAEFGEKLEDVLKNGFKVNGEMNGFHDFEFEEQKDKEEAREDNVEAPQDNVEAAVIQDNIPVEIVAAS